MANLKEVKSRIKSVTSTQQITKAMKMVAAAKLRRATDHITRMRPYAHKLDGVLKNASAGLDSSVSSVYSVEREVNSVVLIPITSDKGLCGGFNTYVIKETLRRAETFEGKKIRILPIGKKALDYFTRRGYDMITGYSDIFTRLKFDAAKEAAELVMAEFAAGTVDHAEIIFNEFKNVATQVVKAESWLPVGKVVETSDIPASKVDYLFEPSQAYVIEELIPKSLKIQFYKSVLESNAGEHGARMTAMDKATENAGDLLKELKLTYNRTRQAAITTEILEIVAGAEALGSS